MFARFVMLGVDFDRAIVWAGGLGGTRIVSVDGSLDDDGPGEGIGAGGDEAVRNNG